jgi:hypothetical protein
MILRMTAEEFLRLAGAVEAVTRVADVADAPAGTTQARRRRRKGRRRITKPEQASKRALLVLNILKAKPHQSSPMVRDAPSNMGINAPLCSVSSTLSVMTSRGWLKRDDTARPPTYMVAP